MINIKRIIFSEYWPVHIARKLFEEGVRWIVVEHSQTKCLELGGLPKDDTVIAYIEKDIAWLCLPSWIYFNLKLLRFLSRLATIYNYKYGVPSKHIYMECVYSMKQTMKTDEYIPKQMAERIDRIIHRVCSEKLEEQRRQLISGAEELLRSDLWKKIYGEI